MMVLALELMFSSWYSGITKKSLFLEKVQTWISLVHKTNTKSKEKKSKIFHLIKQNRQQVGLRQEKKYFQLKG